MVACAYDIAIQNTDGVFILFSSFVVAIVYTTSNPFSFSINLPNPE